MKKRCLIAIIVFLNVVPACYAGEVSLNDTLREIAHAEHGLINLYVDSCSVNETLTAKGTWVPTNVSSDVTARVQGILGGPARLDVHREVIPWHGNNVPSPWAEESGIIAWNGRVGIDLELKSGPLGHCANSMHDPFAMDCPPHRRFVAGSS
jgi:hypothetical protein